MGPRIYPSEQSTNVASDGTLILSFDDTAFNSSLSVTINGVQRPSIFRNTNGFSYYNLKQNDVVTLINSVGIAYIKIISVYRRDYTTDDQGGNNGIVDTLVTGFTTTGTTYTFTATTIPSAYHFEYRVSWKLQIAGPTPTPTSTPTPTPTPAPVNPIYNVIYNTSAVVPLLVQGYSNYEGTNVNSLFAINDSGIYNPTFSSGITIGPVIIWTFDQGNLAVASDGNTMMVGGFEQYKGVTVNGILKLDNNGNRVSGFTSGTGFSGGLNPAVIINGLSNTIYVLGQITQYNGTSIPPVVKINYDGSLNTGFTASGVTVSFTDLPYGGMVQQTDGKILVVGTRYQLNYSGSTVITQMFRLSTDGSRDVSFNFGYVPGGGRYQFTNQSNGTQGFTSKIAVQSSGKIIVSGTFDRYNDGSFRNTPRGIIRLNTDGSLDSTFNNGGAGLSYGMAREAGQLIVQSDDKIIAIVPDAGQTYNGTSLVSNIFRLNSNGTLDTSFNLTLSGYAVKAALVPGGDILIVGGITNVNGTPITKNVVRVSSTGTLIW